MIIDLGIDSKIILIFNLFSQNKTDDYYRLGVLINIVILWYNFITSQFKCFDAKNNKGIYTLLEIVSQTNRN